MWSLTTYSNPSSSVAPFAACSTGQTPGDEDGNTTRTPSSGPGSFTGIRIAMAHGGVIDFAQSAESETPNLIDAGRVLAAGFDYLALGDWHGLFRYGPRVWYPGAHEPTRFKEADPGHVLIVEIDGPGAEPKVTPLKVAQTHWLTLRRELLGAVMRADERPPPRGSR